MNAVSGIARQNGATGFTHSEASVQSEDNRPLNAEKAQVERSFESQTVEREGGEKYKLGQRVWGAVLRLTETQAVIALGEEGLDEGTLDLVHLRDEFGNLDLSEGDQVQAFIIELEPAIKLAPSLLPPASEVMRRLQEAFSRGDNVRGRVMAINRGGLEIDVDGRRAFCPYSQIEIGRSEHPEIYINHILDFRVMELDEEKRRVVLSRRAVLEEERREALGELRSQIKEGADVDGVVTRLQPFGAFVDIGGGIEGLVHVSEISHDRIDHPSAVLQPGEKARVRVLSIARDPQGHERIKLSIKALLEDPWLQIDKLFHSGDIITGTVVRITEFGAFVKVHPGIEGLLHVSQYKPSSSTGEDESENAAEPGAPAGDAAPFVGQEIVVRIARIEPQRRRISLNLREPERTERPEFEASVGEVLEGVVRAIRPFGVFVDLPSLGEYASGLLPAAETGLPRGVNLKRKYNPGDKLRVEIVEIDERGRVRLSQRSVREREERGEGAASGRGLTTSPPGGFNVFAEAFRKAQEKKERGDAR